MPWSGFFNQPVAFLQKKWLEKKLAEVSIEYFPYKSFQKLSMCDASLIRGCSLFCDAST